jgi:hypothetical protein
MDTSTLRSIPLGESVSMVTYGFPAPVPTPGPVDNPSYSQVPAWLRPPGSVPAGASVSDTPGYLAAYTDRVLVTDPAEPGVVFLLDSGLRHRVLVYYPYCVVYPEPLPVCEPLGDRAPLDFSRGGDAAAAPPYPYILRRRPDADCRNLYPNLRQPDRVNCGAVYEDLFADLFERRGMSELAARQLAVTLARESADYVANVDEIPLGEPAPLVGWGRGESIILTDRVTLPEARPCRLNSPNAADRCSSRFENAQQITIEAYVKDPTRYSGTDVRLRGVACFVRWIREQNVVRLTLGLNAAVVPAVAPGRIAQQDPAMSDNTYLEVGASVTPAGEGLREGELVIFEYFRIGGGTCRRSLQ